jgi:hypothetical protein
MASITKLAYSLSRCDEHRITSTGTAPLDVSVCRPTRTNHSVRFRDDDPTDLASGSIPISTTKQDITMAQSDHRTLLVLRGVTRMQKHKSSNSRSRELTNPFCSNQAAALLSVSHI